jgi:hypothetical protein
MFRATSSKSNLETKNEMDAACKSHLMAEDRGKDREGQ